MGADLAGIFQLMNGTQASNVGNNSPLNSLGYWTGGNNEGAAAHWVGNDQFDQLVQSGAIKPSYDSNGQITDFGLSTDPNAVNTMAAKLPQTAFGGISRDISSLQQTGQQLYAPNVQYNDKNYGQITPSANVMEGHSTFDQIGNMVPSAIMAAAAAATLNPGILGAGFAGGGLGGLGGQLFNTVGNMMEGNKVNPLNIAMSAAGQYIPGMDQIGQYLKYAPMAMNLMRGNYMGALSGFIPGLLQNAFKG